MVLNLLFRAIFGCGVAYTTYHTTVFIYFYTFKLKSFECSSGKLLFALSRNADQRVISMENLKSQGQAEGRLGGTTTWSPQFGSSDS